uniref:Uncharacterized protein n=1 Tax=Arion vulgaris TaxID=1028688 RepID=A0A0B7BJC1_9EUPU
MLCLDQSGKHESCLKYVIFSISDTGFNVDILNIINQRCHKLNKLTTVQMELSQI